MTRLRAADGSVSTGQLWHWVLVWEEFNSVNFTGAMQLGHINHVTLIVVHCGPNVPPFYTVWRPCAALLGFS